MTTMVRQCLYTVFRILYYVSHVYGSLFYLYIYIYMHKYINYSIGNLTVCGVSGVRSSNVLDIDKEKHFEIYIR